MIEVVTSFLKVGGLYNPEVELRVWIPDLMDSDVVYSELDCGTSGDNLKWGGSSCERAETWELKIYKASNDGIAGVCALCRSQCDTTRGHRSTQLELRWPIGIEAG